ncbi:ABC transporter permease [Actinoplanes sp. NEAU-A12]|uniref:ABC transporter permease n=1 Tax=Actinoplanes sandaracinus TaxID=3045177 RepID=A0ABT6WBG0_9ACTN|nr:ABC transporter permease [Actinoplanes sandaracinus]MDI6097077.1 ABC transporter permease [Actinoplanes sandaracinus]
MTTARRADPARAGNPALLGVAGLAGLLLVIELAPRLGLVDERHLPPASRIAAALAREAVSSAFWVALSDTLIAWALGLAIAVGAGVLAGLVIGSVPVLRALTASTVEFLRPIPSVALIPLAVLLYGSSIGSTLLLVCYAAFWQVLVQVLYGVADVDPVAFETARSFRFSVWARIRHVLWPTALPYVFTGVRLAASVALILAITAELVIGSPGLGNQIAVAQASAAVPTMYALVVVTGLLGVLINLLARTGERRLLAWHQSVRGEVAL